MHGGPTMTQANASPARDRVYSLLETSRLNDRWGRRVDLLLIVLILANVVAVILETVPAIYQPNKALFDGFEIFSVAVFTVEYLGRIWTAPSGASALSAWRARRNYLVSPASIIDLLAIAPFYLTLFFAIDLRFLRVLRLLRLLKLTRYSSALAMLLDVLRRESDAFLAGIFILMVLMVATASGIYLVEHEAQPEAFGSIPHAMWWAVATLTTVGYGDVTPVTGWGKLFGACVTVIGIGMAALPAGILANGLAKQFDKRHEDLKEEYCQALADGEIDQEEEEELECLRREYGLTIEEAEEIRERAFRTSGPESRRCPRCGEPLPAESD
jgi:voltage-gated potassium channel